MKIASLLASGTELVCALGAADELVGRSHECDTPPFVTRLPVLSRPTFDIHGSSGAIDRAVRERLRAGQPLYEIDEAALEALSPDVIITQTHCEVCAVTPRKGWQRTRAVALHAGTLDGILDGFREVARAIGRVEAGEQLITEARCRMMRWQAATAKLPRVSVVCLEWIDPPFVMGNWGPALVSLAGGENRLGANGVHSTSVPWQAVLDADPAVLVVAACGFGVTRTQGEMPHLETQPGWTELRAVREGRVYVADGNLYFNRSGPAVFETIDILSEILHADVFPPAHKGTAWRQWGGREGPT